MEFTNQRIAYWPYKADSNGPGDRRRFVFYAKERNIAYELASWKKQYDIVYLTMGCNIHEWILYKKKNPGVKMVFEITDSYFLEGINFFTAMRGVTKFLSGKETNLYLDYRKAIIKMVKTADAIVCSTPIQKKFLSRYNNNIHVSLDFFLDDITHRKTNFTSSGKLKLVWEGQTYTVHNLLYLNEVFKKLADRIELHIITDPVIKYPFKIFNKNTASLLSSLQCDHYLHEWNKESFSRIIAESDLAIIPLNKHKYGEITMNKPENKLLLFWEIGIPVLTSNSPAYRRVMEAADLPFYCNTKEEWVKKIQDYIKMNEAGKKQVMKKAAAYLDHHHSKEIIIKKWDEIFLSLLK